MVINKKLIGVIALTLISWNGTDDINKLTPVVTKGSEPAIMGMIEEKDRDINTIAKKISTQLSLVIKNLPIDPKTKTPPPSPVDFSKINYANKKQIGKEQFSLAQSLANTGRKKLEKYFPELDLFYDEKYQDSCSEKAKDYLDTVIEVLSWELSLQKEKDFNKVFTKEHELRLANAIKQDLRSSGAFFTEDILKRAFLASKIELTNKFNQKLKIQSPEEKKNGLDKANTLLKKFVDTYFKKFKVVEMRKDTAEKRSLQILEAQSVAIGQDLATSAIQEFGESEYQSSLLQAVVSHINRIGIAATDKKYQQYITALMSTFEPFVVACGNTLRAYPKTAKKKTVSSIKDIQEILGE